MINIDYDMEKLCESKRAMTMDDNKVAILLEDLLSKFRTFGEGQDDLRNRMERLEQKVDGLTEDMGITKPAVKNILTRLDSVEANTNGLIEDMDTVKPSLAKIDNRLNNIEAEIVKLNPESGAILKQAR